MCNSIGNIFLNILGGAAVYVIIELLIKPLIAYLKNIKYTKKTYIHCDTNYRKLGDEKKYSQTEISIKFWKPNVLFVKTSDKGNEWKGEININGYNQVTGIGNYAYTKSIASGTLNVYAKEDGKVFSVKSEDFRENKIVSYLWVEEYDKRIKNKD
jgi:hypothetical protein